MYTSGPIRISYGPDPLQFGYLRIPAKPGRHPVAVVIHGGCWTNLIGYDFNEAMSAALTDAGIATWNIEYPRTADPGGGYPGTILNVGMAVDKLRDLEKPYKLDLHHVATVGHSSGGHLGVMVAARYKMSPNNPLRGSNPLKLTASVPLAGIFDLASYYSFNGCGAFLGPFMGGTPDQLPTQYAQASPIDLVPIGVPQTLIHGTADDIVPISQSENYQIAARNAGDRVSLVRVVGADHFAMVDPTTQYWPQIQQSILKAIVPDDSCDQDDGN